MTFSSRTTVNKKLKEFGIPLKTHDESRRRTGRHVYGYRVHKGKFIKSKTVQDVILKIIEMRKINVSYQGIANKLNESLPQNKSGKFKWYPKTVRDIYLRERNIS